MSFEKVPEKRGLISHYLLHIEARLTLPGSGFFTKASSQQLNRFVFETAKEIVTTFMSGERLSSSSFSFNVSFVISNLRIQNSNRPAAMNCDPKLCKIFYMGTIFHKTLKISGMQI